MRNFLIAILREEEGLTMVEYAVKRTKEHVLRFNRLHQQIVTGMIDESWLAMVEGRDNLFPEIDYRVYRTPA